jgi:microcystin-dependent protein
MLDPQALQLLEQYLARFAAKDDFEDSIASIYGTITGALGIRQQWLDGDFGLIPKIRVLENGELGTANGAYAADLDEILVSSDFLTQYENDPHSIAQLLLEEFGHKLDRMLNGSVDTPGDEGAIFSAIVRGLDLSDSQLQQLRLENDRATIYLDGLPTSVEMATIQTGPTGLSQPVNNIQPYATHNYIIALQGIFPSRALSGEPFLGAVEEFAGNFAPRGWAFCDGRLLSIAQNQALFAILGTTYGGDGRTTFALPDLRGRIPVGVGAGPGLTPIALGEQGGQANLTLSTANLPAHNHTTSISGVPTTENTGGGQSLDNRQPYLGLTPVIALQGIYPSRNLGAEEIIGAVSWFAGNFAPQGYAVCNGQLLSIAQNSALFSILGTTYGGNGTTTFALPDLRGRTPVQAGQGPGLANIQLGEQGGSNSVQLGVNNLPAHAHTIAGQANSGNTGGNNVPFNNQQPYLGLNYEVTQFGIFPSQSLDTDSDPSNPGVVSPSAGGLVAGSEILSEEVALQKIDRLASVGIDLWEAMGISSEQIAKLESATYKIANLDSGSLAVAGTDNVVTIDRDASNRGWFVDETPNDSVEYGTTDPITKELYATDANALGHYDLLTAIVHEQGHILGFGHTSQPGSLMYGSLGTSGRRFPTLIDMVVSSETETFSSLSGFADYIGGVGMFAGNFEIRDFAFADGRLLPIAENEALFAVLGTTYGGNGVTTFALPDYRGRVGIGMGSGGGGNYTLGQVGGSATTTLSLNQLPAHTHDVIQPDLPVISIVRANDAAEPSTNGSFSLTRTGNTTAALTVNLATPTGTATSGASPASGADYQTLPTTATFAAGSSTATINVNVFDDNTYEGNENVTLALAANAAVYNISSTASSATVTIVDNDSQPTISVGNVSQNEGNSGTTNFGFNFTLSNPSTQNISVQYATADVSAQAGSDYTAVSGTVTFNPGETSKTVNVAVNGDTTNELDETFKLNLNNPINATLLSTSATGTISTDDGSAPDFLAGTSGNDIIYGLGGNDIINGGAGDDTIFGGAGVDNLTGGAGRDIFAYDSATEGYDKINDFAIGEDTISISRAGFGLASDALGTLSPNRFYLGASATTADQRFIYNALSGILFYDSDGNGSAAQVRLAQLVGAPNLSSNSFALF